MSDSLRQRLADAFDTHSWEDSAGDDVLYANDAEKSALSVFAEWLRERVAERQRVADELSEPTARTIALVRVDTLERLAGEVGHD